MKLAITRLSVVAAVLLVCDCTNGFAVGGKSASRIRPDASAAVEDALKITASFGINSAEAKVAWDIVEELDASDNSAASSGSLDQECDIPEGEEEVSIECMDYGRFLDELYTIRDMVGEQGADKKASLADTLKLIRLEQPKSAATESSPELTAALEAAKKATEENGVTSVEARLAWETYEDIASSGLKNAVGINLMEECGIESGQDACKAMEELERIMPVLLAISTNK